MKTLFALFLVVLNLNAAFSQQFKVELSIGGFANDMLLESYSITKPITRVVDRHETNPTFNFSIDSRFLYEMSENFDAGITLGYSGTTIDYNLPDFFDPDMNEITLNSSYQANNINILGTGRYKLAEKFHSALSVGAMYVFNSTSSSNWIWPDEELPYYENFEEISNYYQPFMEIAVLYSLSRSIKLDISYGQQLRKTKLQLTELGGYVYQLGLGVSYTFR